MTLRIPGATFTFSDELQPGDAQPAHYFAKNFVIWRTGGGDARAFDAHRPHLGAHLAQFYDEAAAR